MRIVCGLAVVVATLAGCSQDSATNGGDRSESATEAPTSENERTAGPSPPEWFREREELPSCGLDAEYTPEYPNLAARECFQDAYRTGRPAELGVVTYGDEGESALRFFRVLEQGSYEVFEEQRPSPDPPAGDIDPGALPWVQYTCTSFTFLDEPGFQVDGAPILNNEGGCRTVRTDT